MISVIVVTYNQEKTISRTLDSILRQQCHEPIEIIIGEDCSSDGTLAICQDYAERYPDIIRLFANNHNKGLLDNYYDCMLAANGDYLADLAGDDEWSDPLKLEKELNVLEQHPDVVLVHTDYLLRDATTGAISKPAPKWWTSEIKDCVEITGSHDMVWHILEHTWRPAIHLCTALWRRFVFLDVYNQYTKFFRNKEYYMEDLQLTALLSTQGRVAYLPEVTLWYECGKNSAGTSVDSNKQYNFDKSVLIITRDLFEELHLESKRTQAIYEPKLFSLIMHAFRANNQANRNEGISLTKALLPHMSFRILIIYIVTYNNIIWHSALLLRKVFIKLKRLL